MKAGGYPVTVLGSRCPSADDFAQLFVDRQYSATPQSFGDCPEARFVNFDAPIA